MGKAAGLTGLRLAFLSVILDCIWRTNGRHLYELQNGHKEMAIGQREVAKGIAGIDEIIKILASYYLCLTRGKRFQRIWGM